MLELLLIALTASNLMAAWSYPGCDTLKESDFQQKILVGKTILTNPLVVDPYLLEPIELDMLDDGQGNVDIYFCERRGKLKMYDASVNKVLVLGTVPTYWQTSNGGLLDTGFNGLILHPDFKTNGWIFLWYTPIVASKEAEHYRLSRFRIDGNTLIMESEKIIFSFPIKYDTQWHSGGSMHWDIYGDLWIAVGKNATDDPGSINEKDKWLSCEYSSANTKSIRGAIMRIHPINFPDSETPPPGIGRTYTIPKGNYGDYFALKYAAENNLPRANEFRDTSRVLPELYAHGCRNPWTLNVEPVKRWLVWGENGINRDRNHEEHNFTTVPGFFGFPYFAGNPDDPNPNLATTCDNGTITCRSGYNISATMSTSRNQDPMAPVNTSVWNTGLKNLPPAIPSIHTYPRASAMTGPIYRYDGDSPSQIKLPPHFDGVWFLTDFNEYTNYGRNSYLASRFKAAIVDPKIPKIIKNEYVFTNLKFHRPIDVETGPDGALYVINYSGWFDSEPTTNISRIEYTGKCRPGEPRLEEKANPNVYYPNPGYGCTCPGDDHYDPDAYALDLLACADQRNESCVVSSANPRYGIRPNVYIGKSAVEINESGRHRVTINDLSGKVVMTREGGRISRYEYDFIKKSGVYFVTVHIRDEAIKGIISLIK